MKQRILTTVIHLLSLSATSAAVDFLFNSFNTSDLLLIGDARIDSSIVRLTNDSNYYSIGRAFFPSRLHLSTGPNRTLSSFSTSFVFSILPEIPSSPGFGLAFVLSNSTSPPGAISGQYFGLFSNSTRQSPAPLLAVEFDTGQNPEFYDPDGNHVGIDLNFIQSATTQSAGYYRNGSSGLEFVSLDMRSGKNIRAWIEFDGPRFQINVTIAAAEEPRPPRPLISYRDPQIANYVSPEMFVGFSASKVKWVEAQRILAWSLSDTGGSARELNTSNLPVFLPQSSSPSSSPSPGLIAGVSCASVALALLFLSSGFYYYYRKKRAKIRKEEGKEEDEEDEEWELKYWPRRFSYEDLSNATDGFSKARLLGIGGFGKVYKGVLPVSISRGVEGGGGREEEEEEEEEVAVKCVSHNSKQGLREFMAEISSIGRLQHRSLVPLRGWCRKGNELMLVYGYMPNGNLSQWIFGEGRRETMRWAARRRVLADVAEGLQYLHQGWEQVVLHRDVKSSNILLDGEMRGRLGDFGLAKLYERGAAPSSTRVVGTLGYLAPELAMAATPTAASDVYSFGVVVLEAACGRRPIERAARVEDEDWVLVEWAREMYAEGRLVEVAEEGMEFREEEMELVLKLGLACCHPEPEKRPAMREVVALLLAAEAPGKPATDSAPIYLSSGAAD
ncbi:L-type lectin-domain containing receptor kinase S.1 [Phoenix dactylifera]|uniref:non-specific serine/threonine protein kinase n=1 Tax=Phoenix dactylifera TaxID=42345 RepID=A0A8B7BGW7_PHODC|nr:L-type lectin-domain containing receptor kinase S.1 [Phoenix dactylifera]